MALFPIPTTRSSELLSQSRLITQLQSDSVSLLQLQTELSTGKKFQLPSENPSAAARAQGIQRLLELKDQVKVNLSTSQSYIDATNNSLNNVAQLLTDARSVALSSIDSTVSESQRKNATSQISQILGQLIDAGNQQFRGRYLFAGAKVETAPFVQRTDGLIEFHGNTGKIQSYADNNLLFDSNLDGNTTFGAISSQQKGTVDLNPILTEDTPLANLNRGDGITAGSISVSDGVNNSIVDLSSAQTVGDVARLIEQHPPAGRTITARVTPQGLTLELDKSGGGTLKVREVGGATIAAELGIKSDASIGTGPLIGGDLNPVLRSTTNLADILGTRGSAVIGSTGANNDIRIESLLRGTGDNGATIQYVDDSALHASPGLLAGNETVTHSTTATPAYGALTLTGFNNDLILTANTPGTDFNNVKFVVDDAGAIGDNATVSYDANNKILHLGIDSNGSTQVQTLINQINAEGKFTASYDSSDPVDGGFVPTATIPGSNAGIVTGNTSASGGAADTFFVAVQKDGTTATQVVAALKSSAAFSSRFSVQIDGKDTSSSAFAGKGFIVPSSAGTVAGGSGAELDLTSGFQLKNGGVTHIIDTSTAKTVEDVLNIVNGSGANVLAEINETKTGINIRSLLSGSDLTIGENGGTTATQLGIRSFTADSSLADLNYGRGVTAAGTGKTDFVIHKNDGTDLSIDLSTAVSVQNVLDLINNNPANANPATKVTAQLAKFGNGIELIDDNPTGASAISVEATFGSSAAVDLGLVPTGSTTASVSAPAQAATATLNFATPNTGLTLTANTRGTGLNGVNIVLQNSLSGNSANASFNAGTNTLTIDLDTTQTTASTVLAAINTEGTFNATLATTNDPTNDGSGIITSTGTIATTSGGTADRLTGSDSKPIEVTGVFTALIRLREALTNNNFAEIQRSTDLLDKSYEQINFARGELGARSQTLDTLQTRLGDEQTELKSNLSDEIDVDFAQALSDFTARQAAYQATLQLSGKLYKTSLLDYL